MLSLAEDGRRVHEQVEACGDVEIAEDERDYKSNLQCKL